MLCIYIVYYVQSGILSRFLVHWILVSFSTIKNDTYIFNLHHCFNILKQKGCQPKHSRNRAKAHTLNLESCTSETRQKKIYDRKAPYTYSLKNSSKVGNIKHVLDKGPKEEENKRLHDSAWCKLASRAMLNFYVVHQFNHVFTNHCLCTFSNKKR